MKKEGALMRLSRRSRAVVASFFLCLNLIGVLQAAPAPYSHGDPSDLEQYMLELINRARTNPALEGRFLDQINTSYSKQSRADHPEYFTNLPGEFSAYPAVPPLAFNPALLRTSREHSADMLSNNYFAHDTPSGLTPFNRMSNAGYAYGTAGENITGMGCSSASDVLESHYGLMVDCYNINDVAEHLGHRLNLLDADFKEVGIGFAGTHDHGDGTQDFGSQHSNPLCFLVGVVYRDRNSNGQYDPGEGVSNVLVTPNVGGNTALTSSSGGYAVPIAAVETNTITTNLPLNLGTSSWSQVEPYDTSFRKARLDSATTVTMDITFSGSNLPSSGLSHVSLKRPVLIKYTLKGADNYSYNLTMVTSLNVKADYVVGSQATPSPSATPSPTAAPSPAASPTPSPAASPTPAPHTIDFPQPAVQTYSPGGTFELRASIAGGSVTYSSSNPKVVKITGGTALIVGTGKCQITASESGRGNAIPVTRTVIVNKGTQTLSSFSSIGSKTFGDPPFSITAPAASSGLPVTVSVLSGPAKLSKGKIRLTGAGTVTVAAHQPGNALYTKAPQVTTSFSVAQASQTIAAFAAIADQTYPLTKPLRVIAPRASSGLRVSLVVKSGPATLKKSKSGYILNCTASGTIVLAANQAGNAKYLSAAEVTTTFHVR
jgi:uncharacterized protein YkwD